MELYISTKRQLKKDSWILLGGQPPSGTDHLPVIEIKQDHENNSGSKNSFKPDLVAYKENQIRVFEIKPKYSESDEVKLISFLRDERRIASFWAEIEARSISKQIDELNNVANIEIQGALVYRGLPNALNLLWVHAETPEGFEVLEPLTLSG